MTNQPTEHPIVSLIKAVFAVIAIGISLVGMYLGYKVLLICLELIKVLQ